MLTLNSGYDAVQAQAAAAKASESEGADDSEATQSAAGDDRWSATCARCGEEGDLLCCEVRAPAMDSFVNVFVYVHISYISSILMCLDTNIK